MIQKNISKSALKLKEQIEIAIKDGYISRDEYDSIINIATEDSVIDKYEEILLKEFHQMIYDKTIKFKKS
jgi:hypothetical protein